MNQPDSKTIVKGDPRVQVKCYQQVCPHCGDEGLTLDAANRDPAAVALHPTCVLFCFADRVSVKVEHASSECEPSVVTNLSPTYVRKGAVTSEAEYARLEGLPDQQGMGFGDGLLMSMFSLGRKRSTEPNQILVVCPNCGEYYAIPKPADDSDKPVTILEEVNTADLPVKERPERTGRCACGDPNCSGMVMDLFMVGGGGIPMGIFGGRSPFSRRKADGADGAKDETKDPTQAGSDTQS